MENHAILSICLMYVGCRYFLVIYLLFDHMQWHGIREIHLAPVCISYGKGFVVLSVAGLQSSVTKKILQRCGN